MYLPLDRHGQSTGRMFQTYIEQWGLYTEVQSKQSSSDSQLRKSHQTAFALHKFSTDPPYCSTNRGDGPWLTGETSFPSIEFFFFSSFFFWSFLYILNPLWKKLFSYIFVNGFSKEFTSRLDMFSKDDPAPSCQKIQFFFFLIGTIFLCHWRERLDLSKKKFLSFLFSMSI